MLACREFAGFESWKKLYDLVTALEYAAPGPEYRPRDKALAKFEGDLRRGMLLLEELKALPNNGMDGRVALPEKAPDSVPHNVVTHIEPTGEIQEPAYTLFISADLVREGICHLVADLDGLGTCHDIQVYPVGDNWSVSLHIGLDDGLPLSEAHAISSQIEASLRDAIPRLDRVVIHAEPSSVIGQDP